MSASEEELHVGAVKVKRSRKTGRVKKGGPKRAMSSYLFFAQAMRPKLKEANPEMPFLAIGSELGQMWQKMSPSEKTPYEAMAAEDKARWHAEKSVYVPPPAPLKPAKAAKPKKDQSSVKKRPPTALSFFKKFKKNEYANNDSQLKPSEINQAISSAWKQMSEAEKEPFHMQAAEARGEEQYE
ncbi:MAG: hypothetical protein Q8P67_10135 [archaeon]|nr:hypothetical protein [archaeon]